MSPKEPVGLAQYVSRVKNGEKKAIESGRDSDSGDLSLSCPSKASSGKCQTWKPIKKRLNRVIFSLKFIVHSATSDHNVQKHEQKTTTVEAKKLPTTEAGESLHEVALILPSTTEMSPYLPDVRVCFMCD